MKRVLLILVVLVIIVIGAGPFLMGGYAETQVRAYWAQVDEVTEFKVNFEEYKRGWMSSTAKVTVNVDIQDKKVSPFDLTMLMEIKHGPLLRTANGITLGYASMESRIGTDNTWMQVIRPFIGDQPVLSVSSVIGFNRQVQSQFQSAKVTFQQPLLNIDISWDGMSGDFMTDMTAQTHQGEMIMGQVQGKVNTPGNMLSQTPGSTAPLYEINSAPMVFKFDGREALPGIFVGESTMTWSGLTFTSPEPNQSTKISNVSAKFVDSLEGDKLDYALQFTVGEMQVGDEYQLQKMHFDFDMANVAASSFSSLITKLTDMLDGLGGQKTLDNLSALESAELEKMALNVFQHGIVFDLKNFALQIKDDSFEMTSRLELPPINAQTKLGPELLAELSASLHVKLPINWPRGMIVEAIKQKLRVSRLQQESMASIVMKMKKVTPVEANEDSGSLHAELAKAGGYLLNKSDNELEAIAQEHVDQLMEQAKEMGMVTQSNGYYVMDYVYRDGQFSVNGAKMPLNTLLGNVMTLKQAATPRTPSPSPAEQATETPAVGADGAAVPAVSAVPDEATPSDFLKQQEKIMKELEQQQKEQMDKLNKQLEEMQLQ